jgi:hypothetical protein
MRLAWPLCATLLLFTFTSRTLATTDVRDTPGGKRLLFIDGNDIRTEPGGKRLLFIDDDNIRDEPGGKRLLFVDGDNVRPDPSGIRLAFLDGPNIRRNPGSERLLFIDGKNIRPNPNGDRLWFIDGDDLSKQQLVAVLFILKPELFKLSDQEQAALKKAMADEAAAEAQAAEDPISGKYETLNTTSSDGKKLDVDVTMTKKGDAYLAEFNYKNGDKWAGVGVQHNDELWLAIAPQNAPLAIGIYSINGGSLKSDWYPADADPNGKGAEELSGSDKIEGPYKIVSGKAIKTGAAYNSGTVTITPAPTVNLGADKGCWLAWEIGTYRSWGLGFHTKDSLVVASGAKDFAIIRFQIQNGSIAGDFFASNKTTGYYTLNKLTN